MDAERYYSPTSGLPAERYFSERLGEHARDT